MNDFDNEAMLQELLDAINEPTRDDFPQPNMTVGEYASQRQITHKAAYNILERRVMEGVLTKKCGIVIGARRTCIYWKAQTLSGRSSPH